MSSTSKTRRVHNPAGDTHEFWIEIGPWNDGVDHYYVIYAEGGEVEHRHQIGPICDTLEEAVGFFKAIEKGPTISRASYIGALGALSHQSAEGRFISYAAEQMLKQMGELRADLEEARRNGRGSVTTREKRRKKSSDETVSLPNPPHLSSEGPEERSRGYT